MEKNHRYANQNLSKGQISEVKKNLETTSKWPRQSKKREQSNLNGYKPDGYRSNSKASTSSKNRNQTNYNYDKRTKQRSETASAAVEMASTTEAIQPSVSTASPESIDRFEEQHERTRLETPVRHELHSVFLPGSKKQSLNHLLNFHYAPRDRDQPAKFSKTGNNRSSMTRKLSYNKEQFLQANCQFVVRESNDIDYTTLLATPDQLVDWQKIEQVHILSSEEPQCPICLYPPVAAKMTKCGHVYCWPCILHYLALSDKSWRKCPICYDAVHVPDLRSAVSIPFHSYLIGEHVTFQLMRREKTAMHVSNATDNARSLLIPYFDHKLGNGILNKLLLADSDGVLNIIAREQMELENQIVVDGVDCPENIFVQQALNQLEERKQSVLNSTGIYKDIPYHRKLMNEELRPSDEALPEKRGLTELQEATQGEPEPSASDYIIDEENNLLLSDIDIIPTSLFSSSNYFYFYQAMDGQTLYLHSINTRMLQAMYGSLDKCPPKITGKIVHKDTCSMSEELRKRLKYLQHLPVCTQFEVAEIEFESNAICDEVYEQFEDELNIRRRARKKRDRAERIRERQIFEFNERQLGKSLARSAKIPIDSARHFPMCGSVDIDFRNEPSVGSPPSDLSASSSFSAASGPSWSKMLSTSSNVTPWPSLPSAGSSNSFGALANALPQKLIQITGSKIKICSSVRIANHSESDVDNIPEVDDSEGVGAPAFKNNLSDAIEAALEKVSLNCELATIASGSGGSKHQSKQSELKGSRKKKPKKTLLFASSMNLN